MGMCAHFDTAAPARECAQVYAPNFTVYVTTNPKKKQQKGYLNQYTIVTKVRLFFIMVKIKFCNIIILIMFIDHVISLRTPNPVACWITNVQITPHTG